MEGNQICVLASKLRGANPRNNNIFTISISTLSYLTSTFDSLEEQSISFHLRLPINDRIELMKDLQYLYKYVQNTKVLKLYKDIEEIVDLSQCRSLICLELYKIDVKLVKGLQGLRPQIQKLTCQKTGNSLEQILSRCGADESLPYCWNDLKEAFFIGNQIYEVEQQCLECVPWLHTLDLSHNQISNIDLFSSLHNLKHLNLSYNLLNKITSFEGQICSRLQQLILKNNFIDDITGLQSLSNLQVLDLSHNSLCDHRNLLPLSYIVTLQWLNLRSNPLSYHPNHRTKTSSYLHANTSSTSFILDNQTLTSKEKRFVGSFYPLQMTQSQSNKDSMNTSIDRSKRVREVVIEEEATSSGNHPPSLSPTQGQYLETKRQIEDLREKFGESWLNAQSGLGDVLGLEVSTSYEVTEVPEVATEIDEVVSSDTSSSEEEDDGEDVEGEESIYLAVVKNEEEAVFLVLGGTYFSEKECSSGKEREKWHIDSVSNCEVIDEVNKIVQIEFDTMRKDRQRREYVLEEEIEKFVKCMNDRINKRTPKEVKKQVIYQCMKCQHHFNKNYDSLVDEEIVKCPECESTLILEA